MTSSFSIVSLFTDLVARHYRAMRSCDQHSHDLDPFPQLDASLALLASLSCYDIFTVTRTICDELLIASIAGGDGLGAHSVAYDVFSLFLDDRFHLSTPLHAVRRRDGKEEELD